MSRSTPARFRIAALLVTAAAFVAGCSQDDGSGQGVVFGEGERPPAIPGDFPIPPGGVIGSTMIDHDNHRTEMALQVGMGMEAAVVYFNVGLVSQGYVVGASAGTETAWTIDFSRGELTGKVEFTAQGAVTQVLVTVDDA